jgi:FlaA1/EpsC-like NDP-sugar epimerase
MQITSPEWERFLGRAAISVDRDAIYRAMEGKRILITGAGGCVGSALAKQCAQLHIESLLLLDSAEKGMYELDCDLTDMGSDVPRAAIVGDVCDPSLLDGVFAVHRPNFVFHAAACKHVPLMEKNPFTAARTNAIGTHRIAAAATRYAVEQLILLSTDKAVDPVNIMGATKRIAELIVLANASQTQMKAVRLGNVLGSSGSVVPLFLKQIATGGPVTVTHRDATRYFITLDEAVSLLLSAVLDQHDAAVLIPEPGDAPRIEELARFLVSLSRTHGASDTPIVFTELRPGDKLHERLMSERESLTADTGIALKSLRNAAGSEKNLQQALNKIAVSIEERDLEGLLQGICSAVPEYHPGSWLLSQTALSDRERR